MLVSSPAVLATQKIFCRWHPDGGRVGQAPRSAQRCLQTKGLRIARRASSIGQQDTPSRSECKENLCPPQTFPMIYRCNMKTMISPTPGLTLKPSSCMASRQRQEYALVVRLGSFVSARLSADSCGCAGLWSVLDPCTGVNEEKLSCPPLEPNQRRNWPRTSRMAKK